MIFYLVDIDENNRESQKGTKTYCDKFGTQYFRIFKIT